MRFAASDAKRMVTARFTAPHYLREPILLGFASGQANNNV